MGNLWDMQPSYNVDGVHYNGSGHQKIAQTLMKAVCEAVMPTVLSPLSGSVLSNPITLVGTGTSGDIISWYSAT